MWISTCTIDGKLCYVFRGIHSEMVEKVPKLLEILKGTKLTLIVHSDLDSSQKGIEL